MQITEKEMKHAGEIAGNYNWTYEELTTLIKANKLVIAYLQGRGLKWQLALTPLVAELSSLEGFAMVRKKNKC